MIPPFWPFPSVLRPNETCLVGSKTRRPPRRCANRCCALRCFSLPVGIGRPPVSGLRSSRRYATFVCDIVCVHVNIYVWGGFIFVLYLCSCLSAVCLACFLCAQIRHNKSGMQDAPPQTALTSSALGLRFCVISFGWAWVSYTPVLPSFSSCGSKIPR